MTSHDEAEVEYSFRWADDDPNEFNETSNDPVASPSNVLEMADVSKEDEKEHRKDDTLKKTLKRRFSISSTNSRNSSPCSKHSAGSIEENIHKGGLREKRTRCYSNSSISSIESDPIVLARRQKQIDYGKNTAAYENYIDMVPRSKRTREHPHTPNKHRKYSRRAFDGLIKIWRKQLHVYDPPILHKSSTSDSDSDEDSD